jgi:hypothetical protein
MYNGEQSVCVVCRHFDYEVWYIRHCTEELRSIRELLPRNRNKITAVRKEVQLIYNTTKCLIVCGICRWTC